MSTVGVITAYAQDVHVVQPGVTVSPSHGLSDGDVVVVKARGLPPNTAITVTQCTGPLDPIAETGCGGHLVEAMTDPTGGLNLTWTVHAVEFNFQPFGDAQPIYCRADICSIFVTIADSNPDDELSFFKSAPLTLRGSPATITASPDSGLVDGQLVHVTGTVEGASRRTRVQLVEQVCFHIVQGSGCSEPIQLGTVTITPRDTFAADVSVSDMDTLCFDTSPGDPCGITPIVLKSDGTPDDSFGIGRLGDPSAFLYFEQSGP